MRERGWVASALLLVAVGGIAAGLVFWKRGSMEEATAAAASRPEPMDSITVAVAAEREHRGTTTAVGTVLALRSVVLRNELPGAVAEVALVPGAIVEPETVLVALDVSVEQAELKAEEARATLAETLLGRMERASRKGAASEMEVDRARAELDVSRAEIARIKAVIERKTIRAPFRARVGLSNVHRGQYLPAGTELTTLQSVDDAVHVDFSVPQRVAAGLRPGVPVEVAIAAGSGARRAEIVAVDARVDPSTRNAMVRARLSGGGPTPAPGSAVRVTVPTGPLRTEVAVPVSSLRRGPAGEYVFVIEEDENGSPRAHVRPVKAGPITGEEVLILDGLEPGERVAALGAFKLRESALVAVADRPGEAR